MIREIDRVVLVLMSDDLYLSVNGLTAGQKKFLSEFGVRPEHFRAFADAVKNYPDVLSVRQVAQFTGYGEGSVAKFLNGSALCGKLNWVNYQYL